jgi:tetratricopeptide (TPR) repeat protein
MRRNILISLFFLLFFSTVAYAAQEAEQAFNDGRKAFNEENYEQARDFFLKAAETDAQNPEVHIWLGKTYLALGQIDNAVASWEKALELSPGNATLIARLNALKGTKIDADKRVDCLETLLDEQMYSSVIERSQEWLKTATGDENRALLQLIVADALCGMGEAQKAFEHITAWRIQYPQAANQERANLIYGRALAGLNRTDEARKQYQDILAKNPGAAAALQAAFELARLLEKEGNALQAADAYIKFLATDEAKKAATRWFVRVARENAFRILSETPRPEGTPLSLNALTPPLEQALGLIIDAAKLGDDAALGAYIPGLTMISGRYIELGAPAVAAGAVQRVLDATLATSRFRPNLLVLLGDARFAEGKILFQKNIAAGMIAAEDQAPNAPCAAAVDAYIKAAASLQIRDSAIARVGGVVDFYMQNQLPNPAIAIQTLLVAVPQDNANLAKVRLADLFFQKEKIDSAKLTRASQQIPKAVSDPVKQALAIIKEVATSDRQSEAATRALNLARRIAGFYVALEYYDVATDALNLLLDKPPADGALADFVTVTNAEVMHQAANRDFAQRDATYGGMKKQPLTEMHKKTMEAYQSAVDAYPDSPVIAEARRGMGAIAKMYLDKANYDVARQLFQQIAAANPKWSGAEYMTYQAAKCLLLKADEAFLEALKAGKPEKISPEYQAAIQDYVAMIKANLQGSFVPRAYKDIRGIALAYARASAWDVASSIYETFLDKDLAYCYPEQARFEVALCKIGLAMPEHALKMLELIAAEPIPQPPAGDTPVDAWGTLPETTAAGALNDAELKNQINEIQKLRDQLHTLKERQADLDSDIRILGESGVEGANAAPAQPPGDAKELREMQVVLREKEQQLAQNVAKMEENQQQLSRRASPHPAQNQDGSLNYDVNGYFSVQGDKIGPVRILSEDEINRIVETSKAAYALLQAIINDNPAKPAAAKAREEIMVLIHNLESINAPNHAAEMLEQFIKDNPADGALASLTLQAAMDYLAWARISPDAKLQPMDRLAEIGKRFDTARAKIAAFITAFPESQDAITAAKMLVVASYLDEARLAATLSPAQARGRYVRAAVELLKLAAEQKSNIVDSGIFGMLSTIGAELESKGFREDAIEVYKMMQDQYPVTARAWRIGMRIANAYSELGEYLKAVETYQEFLSSDNTADAPDIQQSILNIGQLLRQQERWVEALHVYGVFVDSFPRHPQAGEALRTIGEIHQKNQAWDDAIAAYERVLEEYKNGDWARQARLSIATCYIQLSKWQQAIRACEDFVRDYPQDPEVPNLQNRIPTLKDIDRFQQLIDEGKSQKRYDAQNEIATIVEQKLGDKVKAVVEYEKGVKNFPKSILADTALYSVGRLYLDLGELQKGRDALARVPVEYPTSPMADDALYLLGQSYEKEAREIEGITREQALDVANKLAQMQAYSKTQQNLKQREQEMQQQVQQYKEKGDVENAEKAAARMGARMKEERYSQAGQAAQEASQMTQTMTAYELANRQDRINAALREAIKAYTKASEVVLGDHAADALLRMAYIYDTRLKNPEKAMEVYDRIISTFPGKPVAEDALWRRAQYYEYQGKYDKAAEEYNIFINNYQQSKHIEEAIFRLAEMYEQQKMWREAMNTYTKFETMFPDSPQVTKARERKIWIKTYRIDQGGTE